MQTRDTTATRGAQVGSFDAARTVIGDAVDSMDGPDSVPTPLERLDERVGRQSERYGSGR
ncbi:hypothetical protein [Haloarcula sp. 1CSR25-25]|uniref:hypothetical protein n=1 Tax=Haloarcula sp. 1CSR25-25 TaxID=2862545 RepID=UPI0028A110E3|nr:hypothetical protein [Haloarcula sp. 1CSR25-25]